MTTNPSPFWDLRARNASQPDARLRTDRLLHIAVAEAVIRAPRGWRKTAEEGIAEMERNLSGYAGHVHVLAWTRVIESTATLVAACTEWDVVHDRLRRLSPVLGLLEGWELDCLREAARLQPRAPSGAIPSPRPHPGTLPLARRRFVAPDGRG